MANKKEIILGVTGSIAAYKSCDLIRRLQEAGFKVSVIMTKEAEEFITPLTLETLSGNRVYRKMFEQARLPARTKSGWPSVGQAKENWEIDHISLAEKADLVLVAPATANIIGKIAYGLADDILSCTIISTKAPVVICPAMNEAMYKNKIVQENIGKLQAADYKFIEPVEGMLACGKTGTGCLAPVDKIVDEVKKILK